SLLGDAGVSSAIRYPPETPARHNPAAMAKRDKYLCILLPPLELVRRVAARFYPNSTRVVSPGNCRLFPVRLRNAMRNKSFWPKMLAIVLGRESCPSGSPLISHNTLTSSRPALSTPHPKWCYFPAHGTTKSAAPPLAQ